MNNQVLFLTITQRKQLYAEMRGNSLAPHPGLTHLTQVSFLLVPGSPHRVPQPPRTPAPKMLSL